MAKKDKKESRPMTKRFNLQPLGDRVVVEREESEAKTAAASCCPTRPRTSRPAATVISVGDGRMNKDGKRRRLAGQDRRSRAVHLLCRRAVQDRRPRIVADARRRHPGRDRAEAFAAQHTSQFRISAANRQDSEEIRYHGQDDCIRSGSPRRDCAAAFPSWPGRSASPSARKGRNVILQKSFGSPTVTKDGVTVAKEIDLEDVYENMGARMVREVASKTSDKAGDGTTTATMLAEALFNEGLRAVVAGVNPVQLKSGMEKAVADITEKLKSMSISVKNKKEEIAQVGTIAANNDTEIGKLLADAMEKVGKDGVITVDEGKSLATEVEWVEGMQFDRGYLSPYFVTDPADDGMRAGRLLTSSSTRRRSPTSRSWCRCWRRWSTRASRC